MTLSFFGILEVLFFREGLYSPELQLERGVKAPVPPVHEEM